jgi:hypothetical protein
MECIEYWNTLVEDPFYTMFLVEPFFVNTENKNTNT